MFANKGGQVIIVTIMIALCVILLAFALAPALKQFNEDLRAPTSDIAVGLDCNNSSISTFDKGTCLIADISFPYFIAFLIFLAGAIITAKLIGGSG